MRIVRNPARRALRAYSAWAHYATIAVSILQQFVPVFAEFVPWWALLIMGVLYVVALIVEQPELHK